MCGLAGIVSTRGEPVAPDDIRRMTDRLAHRGPDDVGYLAWTPPRHAAATADTPAIGQDTHALPAGTVAFGHRRLAVLDLTSAGRQPMASPDGRYILLFNGEIYNYRELRDELAGEGWAFRSRCDTEVLLAALARWGRAALGRLVGMFALALLDTRTNRLLLARDFFGIKPLYHAHLPGRGLWAFASEIAALETLDGLDRTCRPQRVYEYLRFGLTDHGDQTLLAGVSQLPPAHAMQVDLARPTEAAAEPFWHLPAGRDEGIDFRQAVAAVRETFLRNIDWHLRSDVAVGSALSGGVDSSAIVAAMRHVRGDRLDIQAVHFAPADAALSERPHAQTAAAAAHATLHVAPLDETHLQDEVEALLATQDQPFGSLSILAQRAVFAEARRQGLTVMLDGQGADELLGGYTPQLAIRLAELIRTCQWGAAWDFYRHCRRLPGAAHTQPLLRAIGQCLPAAMARGARGLIGRELAPNWLDETWLADHRVAGGPIHSAAAAGNLLTALAESTARTSLPMLLRYEDRNSMAFSIESRTPFLTPDLAATILSLPPEMLIDGRARSKSVFREAMRGLVPDSILDRRDKIGFAAPDARWLARLAPWVRQVLDESDAGPLRMPVVRQRADDMLTGRSPFDLCLWRWVNLLAWAREHGVNLAGGNPGGGPA